MDVDEYALLKLARRMRHELEIKDRKYAGRLYKNAFLGHDAANWLIQDTANGQVKTSDDAVGVGNLMMQAGLVKHASGDPTLAFFDSKNHLYCFNESALGTNAPAKILKQFNNFLHAVKEAKFWKKIEAPPEQGQDAPEDAAPGPGLRRMVSSLGVVTVNPDAEDHELKGDGVAEDDADDEDDTGEAPVVRALPKDVDVAEVCSRMINDTRGLTVKDRRWGFQVYQKVFLGTDAVKWLMKDTCGGAVHTAEDAVAVGNLMMDAKLIHQVSGGAFAKLRKDGHRFRNRRFFYRFSEHDSEFLSHLASSASGLSISSELSTTTSHSRFTKSSVTIQVMEAKDLRAGDVGGTSDPYCRIFVENQRYQTSIITKTLHPVWNETFVVPLQRSGHSIQVGVFDKNNMSKDEFLGMAFIPLRNFPTSGETKEAWYPLMPRPGKKEKVDKKKRPVSGSIRLSIKHVFHLKDFLSEPPEKSPEELRERKKKKELGLSSKALARNVQRIQVLVQSLPFDALGKGFADIIWWENPSSSVFALVVWLYVCWKAPPAIFVVALPAYLLYVMGSNYINMKLMESSNALITKAGKRKESEDEADMDLEDMDDEASVEQYEELSRARTEAESAMLAAQDPGKVEKKPKKVEEEEHEGVLAKLKRVHKMLGDINDSVDGFLQVCERFQSALNWRDQTVSFLFFCILLLVTIVLLFAPLRILLMLGGAFRIMKYWLKTPDERARRFSTPNAALNLIQHAPLPAELYLNELSCTYELLKA